MKGFGNIELSTLKKRKPAATSRGLLQYQFKHVIKKGQKSDFEGYPVPLIEKINAKTVAVLLVFFVTCEARNNTEKISMTQEWNAWREHKSRSVKDGKRHAQIRSVLLRAFMAQV